ncbi:hypothetical protein [Puia dinghuensis]|uniref:Macroglobulin domain-containing protein n=1 Tax=Puia dinghuensis TaxID=1792502 RepID=A0A8J2UE13_9BACT|nr:hypothetical protein [Puia dinghuensis]GGB02217.1 hypothetical protein GCM10011511_26860 [Puia dinghuensis]
MQRIILYVCLALGMGTRVAAQSPLDSLAGRFPQEKVYLHFDRYAYSPGETIWFKAYLLSGFEPSTLSRNIYVDWYDVTGRLLKHMAAPVLEASARGQFDIPAGYTGGSIHVRVYTQWMLNFDSGLLYDRDIPVAGVAHHPQRNAEPARTEIGFFPEGGALITGLPCKVAFKANNQWGIPVMVSGVVQGSDGSFVDSLTVEHDGMGSFFIRPGRGVKYWAMWADASGQQHRNDLPVAAAGGVGLQVQPHADQSTVIVRRTAEVSPMLNLVVHMNQHVIYAAQLNLTSRTEVAVQVPTDSLPTGILQYTLFDAGWKPLAERVSFVNNRLHLFPVDVKVATAGLGRRALNAIEVNVPDTVFTNLSVSVTDADLPAGSDDIVSTLLLSDDIRGAVYHPSYYFSSGGAVVARQLDLVMLTHGWRRFFGQGGLSEMRYPRDSGYLELKGRVREAVAGQPVMLILQAKDSSRKRLLVPVSKDGMFVQRGLVFYDTLKVFYGGKSMQLGTNLLPAPPLPPTSRLPDTTGMQRVQYFEAATADKEKKRQAMVLAPVTVKGHTKRPVDILDEKYATGPFKREAGYQFDVKDDPLAVHSTDIFYYLRQVVPGLEVQYKDGYPVVTWRQSTPGFFVDEAGMRADLVGDIPITEIAYVKVFYPPFLMGGVINPRAGAIAIYTKKGEDVKPLPTKGLNYTLVEGYAAERQFYSPDYSVDPASQTDFLPDVRPTLYWNPYIITDANTHTAEFKFYNNDVSRRLRVVVEGMNATGRLVHVEKIIE